MGTDLASTHSGDTAKGLEPPFPQVLALDRQPSRQKKKKRQESMLGGPSRSQLRCLGEAPSPCQACIPGWVPVLLSPSGFVLASGCHGYRSQLLWQKRLPQGRALPLLLTSPCSTRFQVPRLPRGWIKGKEAGSQEGNRCPQEKLGENLSSQIVMQQP